VIRVHYNGRLGNKLFQYTMGRLLAEDLGYELRADAINGFPATTDTIKGLVVDTSMDLLLGQTLDLEKIHKNKIGYVLNGWFQRYEYYAPHKQRIRSWFNKDKGPNLPDSTVVVHLRRTQLSVEDTKTVYNVGKDRIFFHPDDNITYNDRVIKHLERLKYDGGATLMANSDILPFEWYENILNGLSFSRLIICTDCPDDPYLEYFDKYNPEIIHSSVENDFCILRNAPILLSSISTMGWWAGFLSDGRVYLPQPNYGCWGHPKEEMDIALTIEDDDRFTIIKATRNGTFF